MLFKQYYFAPAVVVLVVTTIYTKLLTAYFFSELFVNAHADPSLEAATAPESSFTWRGRVLIPIKR